MDQRSSQLVRQEGRSYMRAARWVALAAEQESWAKKKNEIFVLTEKVRFIK